MRSERAATTGGEGPRRAEPASVGADPAGRAVRLPAPAAPAPVVVPVVAAVASQMPPTLAFGLRYERAVLAWFEEDLGVGQ